MQERRLLDSNLSRPYESQRRYPLAHKSSIGTSVMTKLFTQCVC